VIGTGPTVRGSIWAYGPGAVILAVITCGSAHGANCALRNPDRQIYEIFPEATNYRSVVAIVDADLRQRIEQQLGSNLSKSDVGKHTAYLVLKDSIPIGLVHARTEDGAGLRNCGGWPKRSPW